jgi:choline dehydrogenase-like flavoprotein
MTTDVLSESQSRDFHYVIVGGGTAGCVVASRLAEYLPHKKILLVEAGPSDFNDDRVLNLKDWLSLMGSELDYDYETTEQPNGMNDAKLLKGNGMLTQERKFTHSSFTGQSSGRMLLSQYTYLLPTLRTRLRDLGVIGLLWVELQDLHTPAR